MKKLLHLAFLSSAIIFSSCQLFTSLNEPVKQYFDDLTNSAKINSYDLPSDYVYATDSAGNTCIPSSAVTSNGSLTVSLTLMNPQKFTIEPSVSFSSLAEGIDSSNVTVVRGDDCYTLLLNLPKSFLTSVDETTKNLSTTIGIKTTVSGVERTFENYSMDLNCNSVPPEIYDAVIYTDGSYYVICFNLPSQSLLSSIHKDISTLTINGTSYNIAIAADGTASFANSLLNVYTSANTAIGTDNVTFTNADTTTTSFTKNNVAFAVAGQPAYIKTSDALSKENKTYTLTLTDSAGLSSSVATSVQAVQLSGITLTNKSGKTITTNDKIEQDEGSSYATINVTPASTASDGSNTSDSIIIYEAYEGTDDKGTPLYNGKNLGGALSLKVPSGKIYLRVHAHKDMFADSSVAEYSLQIQKTTLYVSSSGNDTTGNGSESKPYATITYATEQFTDKPFTMNNITLLTDITDNGSIPDATTKVKLIGQGHTVTGNVTNKGTLTAENVTFKGNITNTGTLNTTGVTFENTIENTITNNGSISLKDSTVNGDISNNKTLEFKGSTTVNGTVALAQTKFITLSNNDYTGTATISPAIYDTTTTVLAETTNNNIINKCSNFSVVDDHSGTKWYVDIDGKIQKTLSPSVSSSDKLNRAVAVAPTDGPAQTINVTSSFSSSGTTIPSGKEIIINTSTEGTTISSSDWGNILFTVSGGTLTLGDGTQSLTLTGNNSGLEYVAGTSGETCENDGTTSLIKVTSGTLNIKSNIIIKDNYANTESDAGGAITIDSSAIVNMSGGNIKHCRGKNNAGAVFVKLGGTFNMSGGTIYNCQERESTDGGGAIATRGTVTLSGTAKIDAGYARKGGGIYIYDGTFSMSGGTITNCTAWGERADFGGGGIFVAGGTCTVTGGTISNNKTTRGSTPGGGIRVSGGALIITSNSVTMRGNTATGNGQDVHVSAGASYTDKSGTHTKTDGAELYY